MKKNKVLLGALLVLAVLALILTVVLLSCSGPQGKSEKGTTGSAQVTGEGQTTADTQAETTVPEETTQETTEETTEETTVETTQTQETGSSSLSGTGGFVGGGGTVGGTDSTDSTEPEQPQELEVPDPGTQQNPYGEVITENTKAVTSVMIPAGGEVYYYLVGAQGKDVTVNDLEAALTLGQTASEVQNEEVTLGIPLQKEETPVLVKLQNQGKAEKAFVLNFAPQKGTENNPEEIQDITSADVTIPANWYGGYYLSWYVPYDGTLTVTPKDGKYTLILKNGETLAAATPDGKGQTLSVEAGDVITIQLTTEPVDQQANVKLTADYVPDLGTEHSPIQITDFDQPIVAQVPAGKTVYYRGNIAGMILSGSNVQGIAITVDGQTVGEDLNGNLEMKVPTPTMNGQVIFGVHNTTQTDAQYTLYLNWPVGHIDNPEVLTLGEHSCQVEEGPDLYYYTWTADTEGLFTLTIYDSQSYEGWQYQITRMTQDQIEMGDLFDYTMDDEYSIQTVYVQPGDVLSIAMAPFDEDDWSVVPAGTVKFDASFKTMPGTQGNPLTLLASDFPYTTQEIEPGETIYYEASRVYDMTLTAYSDTVAICINGTEYLPQNGEIKIWDLPGDVLTPTTIAVKNTGTEKTSYVLDAYLPLGIQNNPAELVMGSNTAIVEDGAGAYFYLWTAPESGTLSLQIDQAPGGWQYAVTSKTNSTGGDLYDHDLYPEMETFTLEVAAEEEIELMIAPFDPDNWTEIPAGSVTFTASFLATPGSVNNPIPLQVDETPYAYTTTEMEPGAELWYTLTGAEGMTLEIENREVMVTMPDRPYRPSAGLLTVEALTSPVTFSVKNTSETESQSFELRVKNPAAVGSAENPEVLEDLSTTATALTAQITETTYYYTWTAPADGKITFTIDADQTNWKFLIRNETQNTGMDAWRIYKNSTTRRGYSLSGIQAGDVISIQLALQSGTTGTITSTVSFTATAAAASLYAAPSNGIEALRQYAKMVAVRACSAVYSKVQ